MTQTCSIDGCGKPFLAKGLCSRHYNRVRRHGDPHYQNGTERGAPLEWLKFHAWPLGDKCLRWPFSHYKNGYGSVWFEGKLTGAHRLMCRQVHGEPPRGMEVAHSCHVRDCVNPNHLRWATHQENLSERNARQKEAA